MAFVAKIPPCDMASGQTIQFDERAMFGGRNISVGEQIFIWTSEKQGGRGLAAVGLVTRVETQGSRVAAEVLLDTTIQNRFGIRDIKAFRDVDDGSAMSELAQKLYKQSHNKIAELGHAASALLHEQFAF